MKIKINDIELEINELSAQTYKNISIIPITSKNELDKDILTLKKGLNLGIVEIKECEHSTVSHVSVTNNAVTPLILIDGEEIIGAKQNRIMNKTILIPPKTTMSIPVSCTERGRWSYKTPTFKSSDYIANSITRQQKSKELIFSETCQDTVWNSIDRLEDKISHKSNTSAMSESYETSRKNQNNYLKHFKIVKNQTGLITIINNEIKGIEIINKHNIYKEYHDKILRSYIIDEISSNNFQENPTNKIKKEDINQILKTITNSKIKNPITQGLGKYIQFRNDYGTGSTLIYQNNIAHINYFKNSNLNHQNESPNHTNWVR